ncbi:MULTISPECIES: NAD(P)-dependent oxidoreductase [unclassified Microbacterium]|uniref:NAD(P)-dependent oxidoreductase n=1 Tax=unclassified Microbacterium TaxID=2609290 RepID=UPI00214C9486|nr:MULTISPECIES: NAD(P)-dependent oxidoreductase [unclassified Microbacterium]MCR2810449.1 NAD(P)-dependent oxidoreductase [Microbacterium sp. zg.B185]WIM18501.1 NAD(P)-dependent oxidoreductase [Microbacterium sp. zg-B185]
MTRIGFTGVGAMGAPIVRNLLSAGHDVKIWGRSPAALEPLLEAGATRADELADVADQDVVLGCLLDGTAIEEVYLGGLLRHARPGQLFADHGTYSPLLAERVAAAFAERGAYYLDAPVSGGPMGAAAGTLVCAVGGDAAGVDQLRPIAEAYTQRVAHLGGPGRGLALKLINNFLVSINFVAAAETAWLIERLGLDPASAQAILYGGLADGATLRQGLTKALAHDYEAGGMPLGGLVEVQRNIAELLESVDFRSGLFPYTREVFTTASESEFAQHPSALTRWIPGAPD